MGGGRGMGCIDEFFNKLGVKSLIIFVNSSIN